MMCPHGTSDTGLYGCAACEAERLGWITGIWRVVVSGIGLLGWVVFAAYCGGVRG